MHDELSALPDDARLVTLDQNVLIAFRSREPTASAVETLLALNRQGRIVINVTMSTAMEAQRPDEQWVPDQVPNWLLSLGITQERIFTPSETLAFSSAVLPDVAVFDTQREIQLNQSIYAILFPRITFYWQHYLAANVQDLTPLQQQAIAQLTRHLYG